MLKQTLKDRVQVSEVLFPGAAVDEYVVKKNYHKMSQEWSEQ
jgi:hypothetical protein